MDQSKEHAQGADEPGWPWDPADPRTPSIYSHPGVPLSFENAAKIRKAEEDQHTFIDWFRHATDEERVRAEALLNAVRGR